jgi:hypothetical protein
MATDMHVKCCRRSAQNVIVYGRDIEPTIEQFCHDRGDFTFQQHEVAHHHRLPMHRRECDPSAERKRGFDSDAVKRHVQVGAR